MNKQEQFEQTMLKVEQHLKGVDFVDDVLMKAHEVIGAVQDKVDQGLNFLQDVLFQASERVGEYRNDVLDAVDGAEKEAYEESPTAPSVPDERTDGKPVDKTFSRDLGYDLNSAINSSTGEISADSIQLSRDAKITFLIEAFGQANNPVVRSGYDNLTDEDLNNTYKLVRRYGV